MQKDYAKSFRIIRAAFGLKQSDLAAKMPVTASQLSLIESGKRQPSLKVVDALATAVGVPSALVSLLASNAKDMDAHGDDDIADLARALLRVLIAAKEDPQRSLSFEGTPL
jgi:transcriptional regulator with XRE-family HTH domain